MDWACSTHEGDEKFIQFWLENLTRPLLTPRCRWEDIRMDIRETGWEVVHWINLAQDRNQ
jgi:hypothetical protein